jgi:xanthine dehydrogenase accessory factor
MSILTETKAIIDSYRQAQDENVRSALATVVSVEGSAYRRPGVRMLITETGQTTGVLSGGCLEGDVCERAFKVIDSGKAIVIKYDTTSDQDIVWGLGVGCKGIVRVLIEPANDGQLDSLVRLLNQCLTTQRRGAVATVVHVDGETGVPLASRAMWYSQGELENYSGGIAEPQVRRDLRDAVHSGLSTLRTYQIDDGSIEVFIEVIEPQLSVVVFGAGDDAIPLVTVARDLGWRTSVIDTRARASSLERFKLADEVILCPPEDAPNRVTVTSRVAAVLMTHNYLHDLELLKSLVTAKAFYLGCLGPKRRTERLLLELTGGNEVLTAAYLRRLHAPAGLDIGAETPMEIAVSVVAEINAVMKKRDGGLLKKRIGPIHSESGQSAKLERMVERI